MPAAIVDRARGAGTRPNSYPTTPPRCGAQLMRQPGLNSEQTSCGGGRRLWHCHSGSVTRMRFRCAVCEHDGASQNASAEAERRLARILLCSKGGSVFRFGRRNFVQLVARQPAPTNHRSPWAFYQRVRSPSIYL